jgi:hypothetical protein
MLDNVQDKYFSAFVKFTETGKLSFKDLVTLINADISRMGIRSLLSSPMDGFKNSGMGQSLVASSVGGWANQTPPAALRAR